jgi:FKBP-type peptidyl-prolyl cis-trans isomerase FkpA/FKBP-type peptidyl-prolyl cis-trans isomerase FklB
MFRKPLLISTSLAAIALLAACDQQANKESAATAEMELTTLEQRISYSIGSDLAQNLKENEIPIDPKILIQSFEEVYGGGESRLTPEEIMQANREMSTQLQERARAEQQEVAEKNKTEGELFLTENGKKEGVMTTDSGLQYKVLTEGTGAQPTADDTVTVHYSGKLLDGTEFDSSYSRGEPISFPLGNVIPGWTEGLQLMKVGSKYELYIPSALAYGPGGSQPRIPPNAALVFEVELLGINQEAE